MNATNCRTGALRSRTRPPASFRRRLVVLLLVSLLGTGLIGWTVYRTWTRLHQLQREFATMEAESFYLGIRLQSGLERMNGALLRFQLSKAKPEERQLFDEQQQACAALIAQARPLLATDAERDLAGDVETAFQRYLSNAVPLLEGNLRAIRKNTAVEVSDQLEEISNPLRLLCDRLITAQETSWHDFLGASHRTIGGLWQSAVVALFLLLALAAALFLLTYRATVAPLREQLTEARSTLERQERLASLGTLAAGVAHEIRNPLASLKFRLFSLKDSLPPDFTANDDVAVIDDEINRLERIIRDFLLFARPSEPALVATSAREILQAIRDLLDPSLAARAIRLVVEPTENLALRVDKEQIQQVLINLVQNAADSIDAPGGTITLRARPGAARLAGRSLPAVIFEVVDTGKGIPAEAQARLFDPFFSTKATGTGLGLAISERIIEKHGGAIHYQTRLNHGTSFQVALPTHPRHDHKDSPH